MIRARVSTWLVAAMAVGGFTSLVAVAEESASVETSTANQAVTTTQKPSFSLFSRFPVNLSLSLDGGYDTNVNTTGTGNSQGSVFDEGRFTLSYNAGTERSHLTIAAETDVTYFFDHAASPNPEVAPSLQLSGYYNVSRRLTLNINVMAAYQAEPDFSADVGPNRRVGYFFNNADTLSASYHWTSLVSTVSTEAFRLVHYDDATIGSFQDRIENTLGEQMLFQVSQRSALVAEYRFQIIDYDSFPNDSNSHSFLGGVDHGFNARMNMTLRGGVTVRSYSSNNESTKTEPQFNGTLNYAIGPNSSLSWATSFGLETPNSPTVSNTTAFRTGLQLKYGLTPRISSLVEAYYIHDTNQSFSTPGTGSSDSSIDSYDLSVNVQYAIIRHWALHVGFDASGANSNSPGTDYTRQRYSAGLNFTF